MKIEKCPLCGEKSFGSFTQNVGMPIVKTLTCPRCCVEVTGYGDDAIKVWNLASKAAKKAKVKEQSK